MNNLYSVHISVANWGRLFTAAGSFLSSVTTVDRSHELSLNGCDCEQLFAVDPQTDILYHIS